MGKCYKLNVQIQRILYYKPHPSSHWTIAGPKKRTQCEVHLKADVNNVLGDNYVQKNFFISIKRQITRDNKTEYALVTCLLLLLQNITTHTIDLTWTQRRSCHLAEMQRSIQFPFQPRGAPIPYDRRKSQNISTYHIHKQITSKLTTVQRKKIYKEGICHSKNA
jgi:hypothetical protein